MSCKSRLPADVAEIRRTLAGIVRLCMEKRTEALAAVPDIPEHRLVEVRRTLEDTAAALDDLFE